MTNEERMKYLRYQFSMLKKHPCGIRSQILLRLLFIKREIIGTKSMGWGRKREYVQEICDLFGVSERTAYDYLIFLKKIK